VQADGYIANWDAKYVYDFWRPETAIHEGANDGNPETVGDPDWVPLFGSSGATPEWDSGHAIEGAASAAVLQSVFHTDTMAFEACSYSTPVPENLCTGTAATMRTFTSFSQAARENAESRIFVGWHFRHSIEEGLQNGKKIGRYTVRHILLPVA
jgi:hypothetical protein